MDVNITGFKRLFETLRGVDLIGHGPPDVPRGRDEPTAAAVLRAVRPAVPVLPGPTFPPATPLSAARLVDLPRGEVLGVGAASDLYACDVTDQENAAAALATFNEAGAQTTPVRPALVPADQVATWQA